jgi:hypothetical protein
MKRMYDGYNRPTSGQGSVLDMAHTTEYLPTLHVVAPGTGRAR